jgi:hypothetical protein
MSHPITIAEQVAYYRRLAAESKARLTLIDSKHPAYESEVKHFWHMLTRAEENECIQRLAAEYRNLKGWSRG